MSGVEEEPEINVETLAFLCHPNPLNDAELSATAGSSENIPVPFGALRQIISSLRSSQAGAFSAANASVAA
jgi:hypothetical protein